ncbi:MAG: hypothetical protein ACRER2_06825 [Methylococcales bacterium]
MFVTLIFICTAQPGKPVKNGVPRLVGSVFQGIEGDDLGFLDHPRNTGSFQRNMALIDLDFLPELPIPVRAVHLLGITLVQQH